MESPAGGEDSYVLPEAPRPALPGPEEMFQAQASKTRPLGDGQSVVASGTDPRFDQALIHLLRQAESRPGLVVPLSALSRLSRNSAKQLHVLEFLLAHQATIVTTNYLLGPGVVGVRRSMKQTRGLGPTHTRLLKMLKPDHF
ncbi:recombinase family protein [Streptomyces sp. NPDC089915]|uniref:recombinase family protein n=1 Tax=Streptomyces sp. NPDC089915 TaxID=3155186 RepID=UPI00343C49E3